METKVAIYVPDEDATKFLLFQQYYDPFTVLVDNNVFEQKSATILLDFDHLGILQSVRRNDFLYSRKHS